MRKSIIESKPSRMKLQLMRGLKPAYGQMVRYAPHCGGTDRIGKLQGKSTRHGVYKCYQCRKPFTVKVGTVFEDSHVPMRFWLQAMYLL